jgi:glycosyltransferase involved in cell wall biosynthesis
MVVVDSIYIHESGGKTLLEYFVNSMVERKKEFILLLDIRIQSDVFKKVDSVNIFRLPSSEKERNNFYKANEERITRVLCFANVPPPKLNKRIQVWTLFHNSLILSSLFEKNSYSIKTKLLFLLRRFYVWHRKNPQCKWIVQTENMKVKLTDRLHLKSDAVLVMPFFAKNSFSILRTDEAVNPQFLYVADGVRQKNHLKLLEAWKILYDEYKMTFELNLTVPARFADLIQYIKELNSLGLKIKNHGICNKAELKRLYIECPFLIFPSLTESFGLPLLEAAEAGCKVIASDLPYVYDVIQPSATFDPFSERDIAKVVAHVTSSAKVKKTKIIIDDHLDQLINLIYKN